MGPLEAFEATWSQARRTYGQDSPAGGPQFDGSAALRGLQSDVESAVPGSHWRGDGATAYAAANVEHAQVFGALAALDARLAAEIDRSAEIVTHGRTDLDAVRDRTVSAATSVPSTGAGHALQMLIVSRGLSRLGEIMENSHSELTAVGASIQQIGTEYAGISDRRFARPGPVPPNPASGDPPTDAAT